MGYRFALAILVLGLLSRMATAQTPAAASSAPKLPTPPGKVANVPSAATGVSLPSDHGQMWREYDISPYTSKITTTNRPEQAIVDWILRDTGTEVWFSEPLGLLSADRRTLKVYHTPEMQGVVKEMVDRFLAVGGEPQALGLRLVTVVHPNWRGKVHAMLQPVAVQSAGVEAWLASKENAAALLAELKKRPDFKEHNSPTIAIPSGQSQTIARTQPRTYLKLAASGDPARPGSEVEQGQIEEGFSLQISPLLSADGKSLDAVLKCQIDQVEKLVSVYLEPTNPLVVKQRTQIQVPQVVSWRLHERFRWPTDRVLLVSCGVVASPAGEKASPLGGLTGASRCDAILFVEYLGKASAAPVSADAVRSANTGVETRGRY